MRVQAPDNDSDVISVPVSFPVKEKTVFHGDWCAFKSFEESADCDDFIIGRILTFSYLREIALHTLASQLLQSQGLVQGV